MQPDRREFLKSGLAAGVSGLVGAGLAQADDLDDKVEAEMNERLRFLSPPDGVASNREWGLPLRSPRVTPFAEELCPHPIIVPELCMTDDAYRNARTNEEWLDVFKKDFDRLASRLHEKYGLDIGGLPVPDAHQRFLEYRPVKFFIIVEKERPWQFHPMYGKSWAWGFEALVESRDCKGNVTKERKFLTPGPTFQARYGEPILVRRINGLPEVGNGPHNAKIRFALPSTTSHLHNGHTASESDGFPNDWINPRQYWDHHYANFPSGHDPREKLTTLWYHDHRMDYTAANVYAGLAGFYVLFDETEYSNGKPIPPDLMEDVGDETETKGWRLPSGTYDVPLILHDLAFARDEKGVPQLAFDGFNTDGIIGDRYTVNRKIQPRFEVEARKYRFRIYNGGPSRFYELFFCPESPTDRRDLPFIVFTGDGNYQPSPLVTDAIYLGVAQRVDAILDFSYFKPGDRLYLVNRLHQVDGRGPDGRVITRPTDPQQHRRFLDSNAVMRFDVGSPTPDQSMIKVQYRELPPVDLTEVRRERIWEFDTDGGLWTVNNKIYDPNRIDAQIEEDTAEVWTIRNSGRTWHHPIHSHFTEHIILEVNGVPQFQAGVQVGNVPRREGFSRSLIRPDLLAERLTGLLKGLDFRKEFAGQLQTVQFPGVSSLPDLKLNQQTLSDQDAQVLAIQILELIQRAFYRSAADYIRARYFMENRFGITIRVDRFMGGPRRDIVLLLPGSEVKIFMRWKDFRGKYVMHCHNVVHEDHAMMIRWDIIAPDLGSGLPRSPEDLRSPEQRKPHMEPHPGQATAQDGTARKAPNDP
jgi:FtsP/CotA-like multicopper oxidase with cupredoxin domain